MTEEQTPSHSIFKIFGATALLWAFVSGGIAYWHSGEAGLELGWTLGLSVLCMAGLHSLSKFVKVALELVAADQKPPALIVRAFLWGTLKLASLLLLNAVLLTQHRIPSLSILLGIGTMGVVPLCGGLCWSYLERSGKSQRKFLEVFKHA